MRSPTPRCAEDSSEGPAPYVSFPLSFFAVESGQPTIAVTNLSVHTLPEKTRRGGRPTREAMTLTGLHQKFLLHCEVERQLARQTIVSYRSDFEQFKRIAPRARAVWAGKAGHGGDVLGGGCSRLPVRHGGARLGPGDVPAAAHPAQSVWQVAREAWPPQGESVGRDRDPEAGEAPAEDLAVVSGRTGGGWGVEGAESGDPRRAGLCRAQARGGREVECWQPAARG
jgi:hypothetical protein